VGKNVLEEDAASVFRISQPKHSSLPTPDIPYNHKENLVGRRLLKFQRILSSS
jgi:hypothetical protein